MNETPRTVRHRPTDTVREAQRLSDVVARSMGREVCATRRRLHLSQAALAARIGVHQTWISDIELGRAGSVPLDTWVALGVALGRPLAVTFSRAIDPALRDPVDAGHLEIQEALLELAARTGRPAVAELPTRPADPWHSVDVALRDDTHRVLIIEEAWNTFGDLGAAIRSTHRKQAEAEELAVVLGRDGAPYRIATVWIVRATTVNRALVARYPHLLATTFDGSSRRWTVAVTDGAAPPDRAGLVWFDSSSRRLIPWRRHAA